MPTLTARLGLKKPLGTENVTRQSFLDNWDIIDAGVALATELNTHKTAATIDHPDNSVTDAKIGNRSIDDTLVADTTADTITRLFGHLGYMVKQITGKASWITAPAITLEAINTKFGAAGHGHTGVAGDGAKITYAGIAANTVRASELAGGAATDTVIGNRTITDTTVAAAAADTVTNLFSKLGYMVKAITGKANWYTAPATTLEVLAGVGNTTQVQFDNTTKLATTAFVQRALGSFSGRAVVTTTTLTAANAGQVIVCAGAATITLPLSTTVAAGTKLHIFSTGSGVVVQRQGADVLQPNGGTVTSITLNAGDSLEMESNGAGTWGVIGGSAQLGYSNARTIIGAMPVVTGLSLIHI